MEGFLSFALIIAGSLFLQKNRYQETFKCSIVYKDNLVAIEKENEEKTPEIAIIATTPNSAAVPEPATNIRPDEPETCDGCDNGMQGSVKKCDRHVIICCGGNWSKRFDDEMVVFPFSFMKLVEGKKDIKLKVTACESDSKSHEKCKFIVYPESLVFDIQENQLHDFVDLICSKEALIKSSNILKFSYQETPWEKLIVVCVHEKRDKRCGRAGPQIIESFQRKLQNEGIPESKVTVKGGSHIGGHEFAGTLIVYPKGDWYGKVSKSTADTLLEHILQNKVFDKCYRGNSCKVLDW